MSEFYDFEKDEDAILDYGFDWTEWLDGSNGRILSDSEWFIEPTGELEIVSGSPANDDTSTSVQIKNGIPEEVYTLTNRITTDNGLVQEKQMKIKVVK